MASLLYVPLKRVSTCAAAIASSGPMRPAWRRGAVLLTKGGAAARSVAPKRGLHSIALPSAALGFVLLKGATGHSRAHCAAGQDSAAVAGDAAAASASAKAAAAAGSAGYTNDEDMVRKIVKAVMPLARQLGFGGVMGACAAYAAKIIGRSAAYYVGIGFIVLQLLSYPWEFLAIKQADGTLKPTPFIQVNWEVIASAGEKIGLDLLDKDGDGTISEDELVGFGMEVLSFLGGNLPGGSGFGLGLYIGFKYL